MRRSEERGARIEEQKTGDRRFGNSSLLALRFSLLSVQARPRSLCEYPLYSVCSFYP
jgi:hypothetical protein